MADFSFGASTMPGVESTLPMKLTRQRAISGARHGAAASAPGPYSAL
jgi:hypothetical protein